MLGGDRRSAQPSSAFIEALHRRSGGIPFVVEELMRGVGPELCSDDFLDAELPWSLDEAVRQQLGVSAAPARRASTRSPCSASRRRSTCSSADRARRGRVCSRRSARCVARPRAGRVSDDQFWFAHALVADAIAHQLLGRQRRRLHERALAAVQAQPDADHASLAHHAERRRALRAVVPIARVGAAAIPRRRAPRSRRCAWPAKGWRRSPTTPSCWPSPPRPRGGSTSSPRRCATAVAGGRSPSTPSTASTPSASSPACYHEQATDAERDTCARRAGADGRDVARRSSQRAARSGRSPRS